MADLQKANFIHFEHNLEQRICGMVVKETLSVKTCLGSTQARMSFISVSVKSGNCPGGRSLIRKQIFRKEWYVQLPDSCFSQVLFFFYLDK